MKYTIIREEIIDELGNIKQNYWETHEDYESCIEALKLLNENEENPFVSYYWSTKSQK